MLTLIKIGFSVTDIINFFLGIATGMILMIVIIGVLFIRGKKERFKILGSKQQDISQEEVKRMIIQKQKEVKQIVKEDDTGYVNAALKQSYSLIQEIAAHYFPESKYPIYELTIQETMTLNHYITDRVNELIDKPIIRNVQNIRIAYIVDLLEKKKAVENSKIVKTAEKLKVGKTIKVLGAIKNAINPVYWFRKLVIHNSVNYLTRKVCITVIGIVGEETNKVYSKKIFNEEIDLNIVPKNFDEIFNDDGDNDDETNS